MVVRETDSLVNNFPSGYVWRSPIHGCGLFATKNIEAGTVVGKLTGKLKRWDEVLKLGSVKFVELEWNAITKELLLVRYEKTKYAAINHSRTPNIFIDRKSPGREMNVYAKTDIVANTEFLLDYRDEPLPDDYIKLHGAWYL